MRSHVNFPHPPFKPAQALDGLDPPSAASQKCLHELRSICGDGGILPTSYTRSSHLLGIGPSPFASGGHGDVYKGSLDGLRVFIKHVRVYAQDGLQKATKVRFRRRRFLCSPSLIQLADLLPRSRNMETVDTPEHLILAGHHYHSPPTHFGLDVRRWPPNTSRRTLTQTTLNSQASPLLRLSCAYILPSYPMSQRASATSTLAM